MFNFLLPKDNNFFKQFDDHAALVIEGARLFAEMLEHFGDAPAKARRIAEVEHQADEVTHRTLAMLHSTFITPLDRDQIHKLITGMDDVIDLTHGASRRMMLYGIQAPTPALRELARVLLKSTEEMAKAVNMLGDMRQAGLILKACVEINKLENDGDALRDDAIASLLKNERDAVEVLKWKEIYESVETALDCCEDVANILEAVVLENN